MAAETDSTPRPSEFALSDTIIVEVGSEGKRFTLHKNLLVHHAGFFKGALSGNFKETDDGLIPLEDVRTEAFDVFVDWLYEQRLRTHLSHEGSKGGIIPVRYHAYVLADRLIAPGFKGALLDAFLDVFVDSRRPALYHTMTFAFDNLVSTDPLLQLLFDAFVVNGSMRYYIRREELINHIHEMPQEAFARIFMKLHELQSLEWDELEAKLELKREDYNIEAQN